MSKASLWRFDKYKLSIWIIQAQCQCWKSVFLVATASLGIFVEALSSEAGRQRSKLSRLKGCNFNWPIEFTIPRPSMAILPFNPRDSYKINCNMVLDSLSLLQCMEMLLQSLVVPFNFLLLGFQLFHRLGMCLGFSLLMVTLDTPKGGARHLSLLGTITISTQMHWLWMILTCCRPKDTKLRPDDWHHCRIGIVDPGARVPKRSKTNIPDGWWFWKWHYQSQGRSFSRKQYQKKFLWNQTPVLCEGFLDVKPVQLGLQREGGIVCSEDLRGQIVHKILEIPEVSSKVWRFGIAKCAVAWTVSRAKHTDTSKNMVGRNI